MSSAGIRISWRAGTARWWAMRGLRRCLRLFWRCLRFVGRGFGRVEGAKGGEGWWMGWTGGRAGEGGGAGLRGWVTADMSSLSVFM